jgi:hypothetical protein
MPQDYDALMDAQGAAQPALFMLKRPYAYGGTGNRLVDVAVPAAASAEPPAEWAGCLLQRYVDRPLLIHRRKFSLRLYCVVLSLKPFQVRVCVWFEGGLAWTHTHPNIRRLQPRVLLREDCSALPIPTRRCVGALSLLKSSLQSGAVFESNRLLLKWTRGCARCTWPTTGWCCRVRVSTAWRWSTAATTFAT